MQCLLFSSYMPWRLMSAWKGSCIVPDQIRCFFSKGKILVFLLFINENMLWVRIRNASIKSVETNMCYNSFLASGDFYRLLITFANNFDPDQARKKCRAWSGSKLFDTLMVFLKEFFEKVNLKKIHRQQKSMQNYPACKELSKHNPFWRPRSENFVAG